MDKYEVRYDDERERHFIHESGSGHRLAVAYEDGVEARETCEWLNEGGSR